MAANLVNESNSEQAEEHGSSFFRRLRKGVESGLTKPVPGILKIIRSANDMVDEVGNAAVETVLGSASTASRTKKTPSTSSSSSTSSCSTSSTVSTVVPSKTDRVNTPYRIKQFEKLINSETVDLSTLKKLSWNGIPTIYRTTVWQLLLGYLPLKSDRRHDVLIRKRQEYHDSIPIYFTEIEQDRTTQEGEILRQINVDLPRTCSNNPFFSQDIIQDMMRRILFIWSIRHPASGYVQGMDDLLTPIILISVQPFTEDPLRCDIGSLSKEILYNIEADSYWCYSKLMDNIQDHYTFSQPGLQRMVLRLEDLVTRLDPVLANHFKEIGVQFIHFAFRWMNCKLIRELPLRSIIRIWDTYFSEDSNGFENFHVYFCVEFLKTFRNQLLKMNFQEIFIFLQNLPTDDWGEDEVETILSQSYILSTLFDNASNHLN